jgi:hypothetical protein
VLAEWRLGAFEEKVILVVSEIVTNSVAATGRARWDCYLPPAPHAGKVTRALISSPVISLP